MGKSYNANFSSVHRSLIVMLILGIASLHLLRSIYEYVIIDNNVYV